ncbi:ComEA family DNA-binding protein [Gimesia algae]|uniref:ComE operon protein 1 n=1 Tax=Gimesia algae TaxID=2527971 RepID=A0A517VG74_9PLAN|nr:helix-hairpin-helix domain-containing protein [Gimesia algae]QDT92028.1 ComE operon protein 1 [Gimesia algae]
MQDQETNETPSRPFLGLQRDDQYFLGILFTIILLLALIHLIQLSHWGTKSIVIERLPHLPYEYQVDINQATWVEFAQLEGIGPSLGKRIVAYREANGPFASLDDLKNVNGIGEKKLNANRKHLILDSTLKTSIH